MVNKVDNFTVEVLSNYLFGQDNKPANLLDEKLISDTNTTSLVEVDVNEFMTSGAGRYAFAANSEFIQYFLI